MKNKLTKWLVKPYLNESVNLPIEIGDVVLMGRFKNKRVKVKTITYNEKGDLQINGRPALKFRIPKSDKKLLPIKKNGKDSVSPDPDMYGVEDENPNKKWKNEEFGAPAGVIPSPSRKLVKKTKKKLDKERNVNECIAFSKKFGNDIVLGKNRDRNYTPELKVVREMSGNGVELCYMVDQDTDWSEGMNSEGIGLVNSALFVKRDEKDFDKSKKKKAPSKDGIRIRHALSKDTLSEVVKSLVGFDSGVKGHTIVSDGKKLVVIENTSRTKPKVKIHDISKNPVVRSNHGIEHPEQGYTRGDDRISSETRMKNALNLLNKTNNYKEIFPQFYNHTQDMGPKYDLVRAQNKLWTSSQILMNLNKNEMTLYLIPGAVKFVGVENRLPGNHESKIKLKVRQYEHSPHDKYDTFVTTDEKPKKSAIKDADVVVEGVDDPGILKAVFLAGGPGSGKTWIAKGLFGIPERVNVSQSGLKMVNSDKELKFLLNKFGFGTNLDMLPDELFKQLTDPKSSDYSGLRTFAKELTGVRKKQYMNGRLGMIIDGTGDDFKEIRKQKREVEKLGYDTYMVFVNTSLDIALQRNENRDRILPVSIVKQSHREVVKNIGGFQGLFGGSNFLIIDNNKDLDEETAQKRFNMLVRRGIGKFVKTPIKNKIGRGWVSKNKILKKMTKEHFLNEKTLSYTLQSKDWKLAKLIVRKYGLKSKVVLSKRGGTSKGDYVVEYDKIELRKKYEDFSDFIISVLHEIKHALDARHLKPKKFLKKYKQASKMADYQGLDMHDDNKWEERAERWAHKEWKRYWKKKLEKNN